MSSQWIQKCGYLAVALIGMLALPASVWAQPANDNCSGAQLVTLGTTYTINNQTATNESLVLDPGDCNTASLPSLTRGVWFRFDSTFEGALKCNETSTQNIAWGAWEMDTATAACPSAGPATHCSANDDLQIRVHNSKTYYFLVHTDSATVSTVSLAVTFTQITPPAYDTCDGAIVVSSGTTFTGVTTDCTNDPIDIGACNLASLGNTMSRGIWFRYDHPAAAPSQMLRLNETSTHDISTGVWVMPTVSASCPTAGPATICDANEVVDTLVTAGNTYYFLVSTDSLTVSTVALNLSFTLLTPPANDDCANAQMVSLGTTYTVDNRGAFAEPFDVGTCNTASLTRMTCGVWFRYDSAITGVVRAVETSPQDIAAGIWEMDTAGAACPTAGPATSCASGETFQFNVQPGKTYYILVFTDSLTPPTLPVSITFTQGLPPANDDCAGALVIVPNTVYVVDNISANDDPIDLACAQTVHGVAKSGVWFRFDCTQTGTLQLSETSAQNIATGVWEMDTISAACPSVSAAPTVCDRNEGFHMSVTDGKTYYFLIMTDAATSATTPLSLSIYYIYAPPNDVCENAISITSLPSRFVADNRLAAANAVDAGGCDLPNNSPFSVWFRYDSGSTSGLMMVDQFSSSQVAMGVWETTDCPVVGQQSTTCGSFTTAGPQRFGFIVSPHNTYFINFHMNSSSIAPLDPMDLTFSLLPRAGDVCDTAVPIVGTGLFTFHNLGASAPQVPFTTLLCGATANAAMSFDSWYKWVAPASGKASILARSLPTPLRYRMAVFLESAPGACPTSASSVVRCVNDSSIPDGTAAANGIGTWDVVAGKTYYFQFASQLVGMQAYGFADMELLLEPSAIGRCCIGAASCLLVSLEDCAVRGGTYGGNGSSCVTYDGTTSSYAGGAVAMPALNPYTYGTITVPDTFSVEDVEVVVNINSPVLHDIRLALVKDGALVTLTHRGRAGFTPFGTVGLHLVGTYTFNDAGASSLFDSFADPVPQGVYRPVGAANINNGLRANFHGKSAAGVWTLVAASDGSFGEAGAVSSWILRLKRGSAPACGGICCRGSTCGILAAADCTVPSGSSAGAAFVAGSICNAGGSTTTPCCHADFNKNGSLQVQDIFDFLNSWFAGSLYAKVGGDGFTGTLAVADIFDFLNAWFAGGCN